MAGLLLPQDSGSGATVEGAVAARMLDSPLVETLTTLGTRAARRFNQRRKAGRPGRGGDQNIHVTTPNKGDMMNTEKSEVQNLTDPADATERLDVTPPASETGHVAQGEPKDYEDGEPALDLVDDEGYPTEEDYPRD